jgi:excisionase family DNA binding protein
VTGRLLTLPQAAEVLGCSTRTLRRRIRDGSLPAFRDGGLVRVREADLDRYVAANVARADLRRAGVQIAGVVLSAHARLWDPPGSECHTT